MPGVITHTIVAIISLALVHLIHFRMEFSYSVFIGNFIPDVIKFGVSGIRQGKLALFNIEKDGLYDSLNAITSDISNWFTLGFFIIGAMLLLYHYHYIKKKKMEEYSELTIFFLIGIITHIILDLIILETNPWI